MQSLISSLRGRQNVIWDWNGTLLCDIEHAVRIVNRLLAEERLPEVSVEEYKKVFGFPIRDYYKRLGFDTSPDRFLELCERFNGYFLAGIGECRLWPGARELLTEIKASGKIQSLLSASEQEMLKRSLRQFEIDGLFDHVYGIFDMTASSKVARGHELMAAAGMRPEETVLVGDTDHDLEVGDALGVDVILVDHGHQCPIRLREIHHCVVKVV